MLSNVPRDLAHNSQMAEVNTTSNEYNECVLRPLFDLLIEQLPKVSLLVEESTTVLSERFRQLAEGAQSQGKTVQAIVDAASSITVNGETFLLSEFTQLFSDTLSDSIQKILNTSKMAISMVYSLDDAINSLADIEHFVADIQKINKQANLLALNATIEAVHAGEVGQGFTIVANEMKAISRQISKLSASLSSKIDAVTQNINKGHSLLHDVASTDMTQSIKAKEKLDALMAAMLVQNQHFGAILQSSADRACELSRTISGMVMNIQFQDRTTQYIQNTTDALKVVRKQIQGGEPLSAESIDAQLSELMKAFCLSEFRQPFLEFVAQKRPQSTNSLDTADTQTAEEIVFF